MNLLIKESGKIVLIKGFQNIIIVEKNIEIKLIKEVKDHCNENFRTQEKYKILED